jgi:phosphopentomutase
VNRRRAILLILDSLGVGAMEDIIPSRRQDQGANTFYHILDQAREIRIPWLEWLGINRILRHPRLNPVAGAPKAGFGTLRLQHFGADSYAGHQEIMGTAPQKPLLEPFAMNMETVRQALVQRGFRVQIPDPALPYLLVDDLVVIADNIETDYGQIYNVTAPLDWISFDEVLKIGEIVRSVVKVNRVIALGGKGVSPERIRASVERRDDGLVGVNSPKSGVYGRGYQVRHMGYGVNPRTQVSSILIESGKEVVLIGKMQDVITCEGARRIPAVETDRVMGAVIEALGSVKEGLIAATVQETDLAGHAQDVGRYAQKIMEVDKALAVILERMSEEDLLIISADHGNDPTIGHSGHTREKTFLLAYGKSLQGRDVGERDTLSDIAATIAQFFSVPRPENGNSFYPLLIR